MTAASAVALWLIRSSTFDQAAPRGRDAITSSGLVVVLFLLILAFYPESWINRLLTHLVTVLIGDLLLFAPVSVLLRFLFPDPDAPERGHAQARGGTMLVWTGAAVSALLIGAWLFLAEMNEGAGSMPPLRLRLIVASVYIGLTLAGIMIAVIFLRRPLGLTRRR